jgi:hypothetical protein
MAKVITDADHGQQHLRGATSTLCEGWTVDDPTVTEGVVTCPACAEIALTAIEGTTKQERREWRKL